MATLARAGGRVKKGPASQRRPAHPVDGREDIVAISNDWRRSRRQILAEPCIQERSARDGNANVMALLSAFPDCLCTGCQERTTQVAAQTLSRHSVVEAIDPD